MEAVAHGNRASDLRFHGLLWQGADRALNYGGIGAIHLMGQRLGLAEEIDGRLQCSRGIYPITKVIRC